MTKFKEGDTVNHLSNNDCKMIISYVYQGNYKGKFICNWVDKKGKPHSEKFYEHELESHE